MKSEHQSRREAISLNDRPSRLIRHVDERLVSYNIEMTEVTGGTFWKSYTPGQIAGTEGFPSVKSFTDPTAMPELTEYYPPIDLYDQRLRALAKQLGPAWIRVSGTWATKTYYDFDGVTGGTAPEGYASVLTKSQWIGVLDFVACVGAKLLISVSNCAGDHPGGGPLDLTQAKKIFALSHEYGVDIDAIEFMNEPNMLELSGAPKGYCAADYARDQDILYTWVRANYPKCLLVGPCTTGDPSAVSETSKGFGAGIAELTKTCTTQELLAGTCVPLDVFSYHYYNGGLRADRRSHALRPLVCSAGPQRPLSGRLHRTAPRPMRPCGTNSSPGAHVGHRIRRRRRRRKHLGLHLSGRPAHAQ